MRDPDVREMATLTWQEAGTALQERPVGLLPVGAIEAHGPHLPLDTDVIIACEMAHRAARLLAGDAIPTLLLPPIVYGVSFVGTCFPGTVPARREPFTAYVASVLSGLGAQGFRALVVCNAHLEPAHVEGLKEAAATASTETGVLVVFPDKREERWAARLCEEFRRGARHAGAYETSLIMAARPEAVRSPELSGLPAVWINLPRRLREGARTFAEAGSALGYFGDPATASAEQGQRLFDALASMIRESVLEALGSPKTTT